MKGHTLIRIHSKGGLLTTQDMRAIVRIALYNNIEHLYAGIRQELLFYVKDTSKETVLKKMEELLDGIIFVEDGDTNSAVSSMQCVNVFKSKSWLDSGVYRDIIESFSFSPRLRIGLIDPEQELTPMLQNQLNFVASDEPDYWYLYLRLEDNDKPFLWPVKVDTISIFALAKQIASIYLGDKISDGEELVSLVNDNINYNYSAIGNNDTPKLRNHSMPNYDGIHLAYNNSYWLGITQQENKFSVKFLESLGILCQAHKNNNIYFTTWGSILIRNIKREHVDDWENLLAEHSINTGHSYSELNWILPDLDHDAIDIKRKIVSYFYKKNARTEGLVFGVRTENQPIYSNVLIKRVPILPLLGYYKYDVLHSKDFDINATEYVSYRERVSKSELPKLMYGLTQYYSKFLTKKRKFSSVVNKEVTNATFNEGVHQCTDCLTIYDPQYGEPDQDILPGTNFKDIPDSFECPVCEADKLSFKVVENNLSEIA